MSNKIIYIISLMCCITNTHFMNAQELSSLCEMYLNSNNPKYFIFDDSFIRGGSKQPIELSAKRHISHKMFSDVCNLIDILNIVNYDSDTIHIFKQYGYYIETGDKYIVKGQTMDRGINYALKDTLIQSSKDEQRLKVSWLPQYMYEACINKDFESIARLSCLCAFSTSFKNLQYVRIVLQCSKITSIDVYIIPFDEFNSYEIDQLYELEKDAVLNNRYYIKECCSSKIDRHTQLTISDLISQKMLRKNPDIYCWYSRYVKPLIDSLDIINLVEDTINFKMIYSPNGSYRNLCLVRSNTVNLYVYETRNHIIWDTISPYYMNFIEYKDIIDISKSYDLYLPPLLIGGGDFITNKLVLREFNEYNYLNNKFNLKNENLKTKRLKRNEHVKIFYRAEICDAKLSKYSFGIIVDNNK